MGKKNPRKIFSKNTRIGYPKNDEKKSCQKSAKKSFFKKHMNIVTKNGGKKSEKKILPESYVYREQKTHGKKSSGKSAKTRFFINT